MKGKKIKLPEKVQNHQASHTLFFALPGIFQ